MEATVRVMNALSRLKGVFLEEPGTTLSVTDAARLAGLEPHTCQLILGALEDVHFLKRSHDGRYIRSFFDLAD
jgi:DNA-binding IclR family transcriptional regulator